VTTVVKARTARKSHLCDTCHWVASLRGTPTILPGHRYLLYTTFPEGPHGEINQSARPYTSTECVACAEKRGLSYGLACCTFCCGDTPCAKPTKHDGDHSCRQCAIQAGEVR
jgi:hypothetical protein